jgi:hypothetical protein
MDEEKKIIYLKRSQYRRKDSSAESGRFDYFDGLYRGLPVPADADSEIAYSVMFLPILVIDQSIENALSNFFRSSWKKIGKMLNSANSDSLILVDEIGAAHLSSIRFCFSWQFWKSFWLLAALQSLQLTILF